MTRRAASAARFYWKIASMDDTTVEASGAGDAAAAGKRRKPFGLRHRARASSLHFLISLAIATAAFLVIYFVWFPGVLFEGAGGLALLTLIFGVDVTLGPLLTFVVFVPGKKSLVFDLAVIATLQLGALTYGVKTMFDIRPVYIVFVQDRFELARANDISAEELARVRGTPLERLPLDGPRLMGARLPTDPDEQFSISQAALAGGPDLYGYPRYYRPYPEVRDAVLKASAPMAELRRLNPPAAVDAALARIGRPEAELRFVPMRSGNTDLTALVEAKSGDFVGLTALRPWAY
jgi:hypothetical protein